MGAPREAGRASRPSGTCSAAAVSALGGFQVEVPALERYIKGSWRLFRVWAKTEPGSRAPAMGVAAMRGFAGHFVRGSHPHAIIMVMTGHRCSSRTPELLDLRTGDCRFSANICMTVLKDTKVGGSIGVAQEVSVLDKFFLPPRLRRQVANTLRSHVLLGMTATQLGEVRNAATRALVCTNSFAKVADRRRWPALKAMRPYATRALQEGASNTMPNEVRHRRCESAKRLGQLKVRTLRAMTTWKRGLQLPSQTCWP